MGQFIKTERLVETALWEDASAPANGVLPNVKILGQKSRNKRFYTEGAMKGAVSLYEGKAVYISHAREKIKHRDAPERFGRLKNVRFEPGKKELRGDLVYLESQAQMTAMLKEDLERGLNFFGLSHVADGQFHVKEGVKVVTKIDKVESVDLVSDPATATSLREQTDATAVADEFEQSVLAVLNDEALDAAGKKAKLQELSKPAAAAGAAVPTTPVKEQTETDPIKALTEQVTNLTKTVAALQQKPKKYVTSQQAQATTLTEQTDTTQTQLDAPPKDKAALKKWLRK
ncbi:hypothetical protein VT84_23380 [Gemmata sp. SH-PL17]|uniref:hypothetical protein n=1 Tax=Gemmata sp. SH-PL17 TaxID=1630693 RepID=UPI00078EF64B|nr:hypothetical protein [Gemmata sp. SH-PL17]AMV27361.1 hypothetical protein VT84_23380 [Gemmata sp. SH-PL17]